MPTQSIESSTVEENDIADRLRDLILAGSFAPHSPLRIDALALQFNVSHMPVREALRRLETEGLLTLLPHRGARVAEVTPRFVSDILELRTQVEAFMTRRAAERAVPEDMEKLYAIQARYEEAAARGNVADALKANRQFHQMINAIADNRDGVLILDRHWRLMTALWRVYGYEANRYTEVITDHRRMLAALQTRDAEGAGILSAAHCMHAKHNLIERMHAKPLPHAIETR